ncbi:DIP1984 family protein [soil metagenome]
MKLAEALLERADLQKHIEQLQSRIVANASYQEGEPPAEDAAELIELALTSIAALEGLVTAINVTNTGTTASDGRALTALLSEREALRMKHSVLTKAADAAAIGPGYRQMRSELRQISALPVKGIREQAEAVAKQLRELDVLIQRTNWEADLNRA